MRRTLPIALIVFGIVIAAAPFVCAVVGDNSVTMNPPDTPQTGKIQASGSYSIASGYALDYIYLKCAPTGGGSQQSSQASAQNGAWTAVINPVPGGVTYNVWAEMTYHPTAGAQRVVQSEIKQVTVN